jgi:nitrite reductase (NO-forming)
MKRPASTNARPALSRIFFFLLAVIMFSISYTVSSLAATVQTATNTMSIARDPTSLPAPIGERLPAIVRVTLTARELDGALDPESGTTYHYWTFDGTAPGPMIRVRQGDTVEITLRNDAGSLMQHSLDFHAALGPGGGAQYSSVPPGETRTFTFGATTPGLFVYHCATAVVAQHIANGMYGLILVEPPAGLPPVSHEFYVMQGEVYTTGAMGGAGMQKMSVPRLLDERPNYVIFNGAVGALAGQHALRSAVGDTIRIFFGVAGPNLTASFHIVGEIFSKVYGLGSFDSSPLKNVQTVSVPPGAAAVIELSTPVPGRFMLMDHAMSRVMKGSTGYLEVTGPAAPQLMHEGPAGPGSQGKESTPSLTGGPE